MGSNANPFKQIESEIQVAMAKGFGANPIRLIESELQSGELLLWTGCPYRGIRKPQPWRNPTGSKLISGVVLTVFLICFAGNAARVSPLLSLAIVAITVLAIALYIFVADPSRRRGTYYGLTNRRVLVIRRNSIPVVQEVNLRDIKRIELNVNDYGNGTIKCYAPSWPGWGKVNKKNEEVPLPLFKSISDARCVYELLQRQMNAAKSA